MLMTGIGRIEFREKVTQLGRPSSHRLQALQQRWRKEVRK